MLPTSHQFSSTHKPSPYNNNCPTRINRLGRPNPAFHLTLDRLGQNPAPSAQLVQTPAPAINQMCTQAPDMFDETNPEDLWTFLLQCQITFNSSPQNFPTESSKIFFAISYLKKAALEWFEQGILEDALKESHIGKTTGQSSPRNSVPTLDQQTQQEQQKWNCAT